MAESNTSSTSSTIAPLDMDWAREELIPFLQSVFPDPPARKSVQDWERDIIFARHNLDRVPFYEDFPLTIEHLRLTLLNSDTLDPQQLSKFMRITEQGSQICIRIFVRHASRQGLYPLFSLGREPNPDFPRGNQRRYARSATAEAAASPTTQDQTPQTPVPAVPQAQVPAASYAQLVVENAELRRRMDALSVRKNRVEGRRERPAPIQTGQPSQPHGGYIRRPDRGYHLNQSPRMPAVGQQTPPPYSSGSFGGYDQPHAGSPYAYGSYMPTAPMDPYSMQRHQQQYFVNPPPPPQFYGGWNGNQTFHQAQQASSSQSGASSAYMMPPPQAALVPQQNRSPSFQRQATQGVPGSSAGQQRQGQTQGLSARHQGQASGSGASPSVLHPEARPFTPRSNTTDD